MATRWPTDILRIGTRRVWGRIYGVSLDATELDALGDTLIPRVNRQTPTASVDIRGTASVGDRVVAPDGTAWIVMAIRPADERYGGATTLDLEQDVIVEGA